MASLKTFKTKKNELFFVYFKQTKKNDLKTIFREVDRKF